MRTIFHVSDLHFGKTDPVVIAKLLDACIHAKPDIVVITGDLTQRAHIKEFEDARAFLKALRDAGLQYFVIPGNHDIHPLYRPIARALKAYDRYREYVSSEVEPRYLDKEIAIGAIDTVRRSKIANGKIGKQQIDKIQNWFKTLDTGVTRIVVTHHPLDLPAKHRRLPLVSRAKRAVYGLASSRVDVYLAGHYHRSSVISTAERYPKLVAPSVAVQAGTVSMRERGEAQAFNILTIDGAEMRVDTYFLDEVTAQFTSTENHRFIRERGVWRAV